MWEQAKLVLIHTSSGTMKWWANTRFEGHTQTLGVIKCTCAGTPTLKQVHIINCPRFTACYAETATVHNTTVSAIKHALAERDPTIVKQEELERLNSIEKTLSEKITTTVNTRPRAPRRPRRQAMR